MKLAIDVSPLTRQYLDQLVASGEFETIEHAAE